MKNNSLQTVAFIFLILFTVFVAVPFAVKHLKKIKENKVAQEITKNKLQEEEDIKKEKIYLTGKFDPKTRGGFILISKEHSSNLYDVYLREETYEAFIKMHNAAKEAGIDIKISSGTRNFDSQKYLWNEKWKALGSMKGESKFRKILEYVSVPGASRHHWGTDIDINGANPAYFETKKGNREYSWLVENASKYGFCQTYSLKNSDRPLGYNEEKWHWSYLPLAQFFTNEYTKLVTDQDISGFLGAEYAPEFKVIENYVLSINPDCL